MKRSGMRGSRISLRLSELRLLDLFRSVAFRLYNHWEAKNVWY